MTETDTTSTAATPTKASSTKAAPTKRARAGVAAAAASGPATADQTTADQVAEDRAGGGRATYSIRAADRVCDLLDSLRAAEDGVTLTALAEKVDLPKSSVLRYLSALERRHYVARDETGTVYTLGVAFRPNRNEYLEQLRDIALPHLMRMRDQFRETVNLGVLDGVLVLHVEVVESRQLVRLAAHRGERAAVHSTAIGKAASTFLSERRIREILDTAGMPWATDRTLTTPEAFLAAVRECSEQGYAVDDLENQPDGRCVAVPVAGLPLAAAVSVSAPATRMPWERVREIAPQLQAFAEALANDARSIAH